VIHTLGFSPSLDISYTVDAIETGAIHRPRSVLRVAGGKSLNASRALMHLGCEVRAIVPLGGLLGDLVAELLIPTGVILDRIDSGQPTRLCVSASDESTHALTEFYEPAPIGDELILAEAAARLGRVQPGEWLTISGNVPPGIDHGVLAGVLADATARGVRVAVDVHGPALGSIIEQARPEVIKVNRYEALELIGAEVGELADLGPAVQARGPVDVVITDGSAGSIGWDRSGAGWRAVTNAAPGGYPVGSGDCFLAGLVSGLSAGRTLAEALEVAAAVGAANAAIPGGGIFDLETVAQLRTLTMITPLR
jgi:1-phosphofructokinase family hexose kinase